MGPLGGRLPLRGSPGKAVGEVACCKRPADAPIGGNCGEWLEDEASPSELRMGNRQPPRAEPAAAPQDDVEVQHARPPALARAAPELSFDCLEPPQQRGCIQLAFDQRDRIGEVASAAAERPIEDDGRRVEQAEVLVEPGDRRLHDLRRPAEAPVRPVRADGDGVEVRRFGQTTTVRPELVEGTAFLRRPKNKNSPSTSSGRTVWGGVTHIRPANLSPIPQAEAPRDCPLCPRLVALREQLRAERAGWWNAPVPAFGDPNAWLAIVGLAPGKQGANRTGRPFTGDYSGELFYSTLLKFGLAEGEYRGEADDGVGLVGATVLNAVKCLPPGNRPLPSEIATCRNFLEASLAALPTVKVVIALGQIAHASAAKALGLGRSRFAHGAEAVTAHGPVLLASYHCSRQNTNTGKLTRQMFESVFDRAVSLGASKGGRK
jgi:uracil-DNA glycosylase